MRRILAVLIAMVMLTGMVNVANAAEAYKITLGEGITVYVNGAPINADRTVSEKDSVKLAAENENAVVIEADGVYYPAGKYFKLTGDLDLTNAGALALGLRMVDGAQVRVGNVTVTEEGKLSDTKDSGIRFLASCDYADTVLNDSGVEFGVKITAEGSEEAAYIKAERFQNEEHSIFTAVVANLAEGNYNRKFTATAYARVPIFDGTTAEFTEGSVTRSIYQVSVGILKNSSAELDSDLPYTIDSAVKEVLAAYVNQSGIRLTYSKNGTMSARLTGDGAYTGDLYFNVESVLNSDGSTSVTITPLGDEDGFFNPVAIPTWWMDYIRINNNNSVATTYISDAKLENGVLSFKFKLPNTISYTFNQEDKVTVVSEVTATQIKGFKDGHEVTYELSDVITVMGLAESMKDVVPGSVIMVGTNQENKVSAVELLASIGIPVSKEKFEASYGEYNPGDGSTKYKNIVGKATRKNRAKLTCYIGGSETVEYIGASGAMGRKVGLAIQNGKYVVTVGSSKMSSTSTKFADMSTHNNYVYLRYDTEQEKYVECVYYSVPVELDLSGDGEYSDIFSLDDYEVIF